MTRHPEPKAKDPFPSVPSSAHPSTGSGGPSRFALRMTPSRHMKRFLSVALLATLALPAAGQQRENNAFNWNGTVPAGRWVRVKNLNGNITVGQASGDKVEVVATKSWRRGDPSVVRFTANNYGENVVICALWGDNSSCNERNYQVRGERDDRRMRNNDVTVDFRILLPRGVKISAHTVNGAVSIDGVTGEVDAETVNGEGDVSTTGGRVNATNVNGNVRARLGRIDTDEGMRFETVNGSVIVEFTGDFGGNLDLQTVNGSLNTNFEMTVSGRLDPKHLRAHVGRPGGPRIKLETVTGKVEI